MHAYIMHCCVNSDCCTVHAATSVYQFGWGTMCVYIYIYIHIYTHVYSVLHHLYNLLVGRSSGHTR